jgi:hypothetical protein
VASSLRRAHGESREGKGVGVGSGVPPGGGRNSAILVGGVEMAPNGAVRGGRAHSRRRQAGNQGRAGGGGGAGDASRLTGGVGRQRGPVSAAGCGRERGKRGSAAVGR